MQCRVCNKQLTKIQVSRRRLLCSNKCRFINHSMMIRGINHPFWGRHRSKSEKKKMSLNHSNNRWKGHVAKPRRVSQGLWSVTHDKALQLQKKRFRNQRYKARKRNARGSHTFREWLLLKEYWHNMCLCCKKFEPEIKLTEDHIMPLSLGGSDYITNIQPLCMVCNTRKNDKYIIYMPQGASQIHEEKGLVNDIYDTFKKDFRFLGSFGESRPKSK